MADIIPYPLTRSKALEIIRDLARTSSRQFYTRHAKERMRERGFSTTDVLDCLQKGRISEGPFQAANGNWQFTMVWFRAGAHIQVVAALDTDDEGNYLIIITTI
ncbi:DUF4258 domain-containing protein [Salmonella enterica]|nr:DUF4258 domain-containing protein [Salmonella enterica]